MPGIGSFPEDYAKTVRVMRCAQRRRVFSRRRPAGAAALSDVPGDRGAKCAEADCMVDRG